MPRRWRWRRPWSSTRCRAARRTTAMAVRPASWNSAVLVTSLVDEYVATSDLDRAERYALGHRDRDCRREGRAHARRCHVRQRLHATLHRAGVQAHQRRAVRDTGSRDHLGRGERVQPGDFDRPHAEHRAERDDPPERRSSGQARARATTRRYAGQVLEPPMGHRLARLNRRFARSCAVETGSTSTVGPVRSGTAPSRERCRRRVTRAGLADVVTQQVDVADAHREHQVARTGHLRNAPRHGGVARLEDHLRRR